METCPVCVIVHPPPAATPPPERVDPALLGDADITPPGIVALSDEQKARRIREEWEVGPRG
jgi:hypothetical protein